MAAYPVHVPQALQGGMLQFPMRSRPENRPIVRKTPRYFSEVQTLDAEGSRRLLGVVRDIVSRATTLIDYMDRNRHEARLSGVETIAVELSGILEGGRLGSIEDALDEASRTGERPAISIEGFSKLRRAEFLIGEVDHEIAHYAERPVRQDLGWAPGYAYPPRMGVSLQDIPVPLLILGVVGAGAILTVVILALMKASK